MIKSMRQNELAGFLREKQCSNVKEISEVLNVSPATVRRDLKALESQGLVRLFHGGAMMPSHDELNVPLSIRENENASLKIRIARKAAKMVPAKASIMLDASSTAMYIANYLDPGKELTVFTNCLRTATSLCERNINTYCIGGSIVRLSLATTGALAESNVNMTQVDYLFFSSQGLDKDGQITDRSEMETMLRRTMIKHAQRSYFLCDSGKFGKKHLFNVCNAQEVDGIISDSIMPEIVGLNWIDA
jgi:DeoR/GlpR family transcriptional regulator of sugar metabolism